MRYARIVNNAVDHFRVFSLPPDPNPAKGLDWRRAPVIPKPIYNAATHLLIGPTYQVEATQVVEEWTVRAKTAEEMAADVDARKEAFTRAAEDQQQLFAALFRINNDVRVLKGQAQWTRPEFRQWVKDL